MKNTIIKVLIIFMAFSFSNCSINSRTYSSQSTTKVKRVPPGQAKKMNGEKSAKNYTSGRNKG